MAVDLHDERPLPRADRFGDCIRRAPSDSNTGDAGGISMPYADAVWSSDFTLLLK
jgi:hypothetical protein